MCVDPRHVWQYLLTGAVLMVCPPVPSLLKVQDSDGSDDNSDADSDSDKPVNLNEAEDTR